MGPFGPSKGEMSVGSENTVYRVILHPKLHSCFIEAEDLEQDLEP